MIRRILFCTDGSGESLSTAKLVAALTKSCGASLTMLNVYDLTAAIAPYTTPYEPIFDAASYVELGSEIQLDIEKRTGAVLKQEGAEFKSEKRLGHPVETICDVAESIHADLIVMGSRGLNSWQALVLGSVSEGVLHHAPCSVLITRGTSSLIRKIMLATDGSCRAVMAAAVAGELANALHAELSVLNVFEPQHNYAELAVGEVTPEDLATRVRETVANSVGRVLDKSGIKYTLIQEEGQPAETIVHSASADQTDLIVMGSRGWGTFKSLLLGSVSRSVAHHAPCSLLVAR